MADLPQQKQSKIRDLVSGLKKKTKHTFSSSDHKKASKYLEHGRRYYDQKKYPQAERLFSRALEEDGLYPLAHYMMGMILLQREDTQGAKRHFEQAIKIDPGSDVARKADKKIASIEAKVQKVIQTLKDRQKY